MSAEKHMLKSMKTHLSNYILFFFFLALESIAFAQKEDSFNGLVLSMEDAIQIAQSQSIDALLAKHIYISDYWQYKAYYAQLLPSLSLSANLPSFNHSLTPVQNSETGEYNYVNNYMMLNSLSLNLTQNIVATGGRIQLFSNFDRMDQFAPFSQVNYNTSPINLIFIQPIGGFNTLKWDKKIEPVKYEKAKFTFLEAIENIRVETIQLFFAQLFAQQNFQIAQLAFQNMDTLYTLSKERFALGSISKNELLQLEYRHLIQQQTIHDYKVQCDVSQSKLKSYLRINDTVNLNLLLPMLIPSLQINPEIAYDLSQSNTSLEYKHRILRLEAKREVAKAKAGRRPQIDLYARVGLNQVAEKFGQSFKSPLDQENINLGITVPIFDGYMAKGRLQMANSKYEIVENQIEKEQMDNKQNMYLKVMEFNNQGIKCNIAARAKEVAMERYALSVEQFTMSSISVLELNTSQNERDEAVSAYIKELNNFWYYYFTLQQACLYDFITNTNISTLFDKSNMEKK